jgi:hypothetical protein
MLSLGSTTVYPRSVSSFSSSSATASNKRYIFILSIGSIPLDYYGRLNSIILFGTEAFDYHAQLFGNIHSRACSFGILLRNWVPQMIG